MLFAAVALASANAAFSWFLGNWDCHSPRYSSINAFTVVQGGHWIVNHWGPRDEPGGVAYIAHIPARHQWIYDDFHYDGGWGEVTSAGDQRRSWTWSGPYYTPDGHVLKGRIVYVIRNGGRYDRLFETPNGRGWSQTGSDTCTRM